MRSLTVLLCALILSGTSFSQASASNDTVPKGTKFKVRILKTLDVANAKSGETFELSSVYPLFVNQVQIPADAKFIARIVSSKRLEKKQKGFAELVFVVEKLTWSGGDIPLNAYPVSFNGNSNMGAANARPVFMNAAFSPQQSGQPIVTPPPPENRREAGGDPTSGGTIRAPYSLGPEAPSRLGPIVGSSVLIFPSIKKLALPAVGTQMSMKSNFSLLAGTVITIQQF